MRFVGSSWRLVMAAVLALAVGACGETEPTPPGPATLRIVNASGAPITSLHYNSCTILHWGTDRLAVGEVIADGAEKSFAITEGCWDVRADWVDDAEAADWGPEILNNNIDENETFTWTVDPPT
jgi:hypothetical protein